MSYSTLTPDPEQKTQCRCQTLSGGPRSVSPRVPKQTCGEHAGVGVRRGETHVLLDASAGALGRPLDRQVPWRRGRPLSRAALVVHGLRGAVQ